MTNPTHIPKEFLAILQEEGISLRSEGVNDIALKPEAALRAVAALRTSQVGITGGEIWEKKDERFFPTYDIWDVEKSDYSNISEYIQASLDIAERQIKKYVAAFNEIVVTLGI